MSYFTKIASSLRLLVTSSKIGSGFDGILGLCLFEIILSRVEVPLQQFQYASVVQRRTRLCIGLVQINVPPVASHPGWSSIAAAFIFAVGSSGNMRTATSNTSLNSLLPFGISLSHQIHFLQAQLLRTCLYDLFRFFYIESAHHIAHRVVRMTQARIAVLQQ